MMVDAASWARPYVCLVSNKVVITFQSYSVCPLESIRKGQIGLYPYDREDKKVLNSSFLQSVVGVVTSVVAV